MIDLFVLLVCMATGGGGGNLSETVDDIVSMTSKLGVSSEEDWEENEEAASSFGEHSLVGRLVAKREIKESLFTTIFNLGILNKQPWIFNGGLLLLENWPSSGLWREARLDKSIFVGRYIPCGGRKFWIQFKFERLPTLCFACGVWGHEKRECGKGTLMETSEDGLEVPKYGQWLKDDDPIPHCFSAFHQNQAETHLSTGISRENEGEGLTEVDDSIRHFVVAPETGTEDRVEAPMIHNYVTAKSSGIAFIGESSILGDGEVTNTVPGGNGEKNCHFGTLDQVSQAEMFNVNVPKTLGRAGNFNVTEPNTLGHFIKDNNPKENRDASDVFDKQQGGSTSDGITEGAESEAKKRKNGGKDGETEEERDRRALLKGKQIINDLGVSSFSGGVNNNHGEGEKVGKSSIHGNRKKVSIKNRARNQGKGRAVVFTVNDGGVHVSVGKVDSNEMGQQFVFGSGVLNGTNNVVTTTENYWTVDRVGLSGGLLLLWKEELSVRVDASSPGDFNEIVSLAEKVGGRLRRDVAMEEFRSVIDACRLIDFCSSKTDLTWCNGHEMNPVMERLDRALCNEEWLRAFNGADVMVLDWWESDHRPLVVDMPIDTERERCGDSGEGVDYGDIGVFYGGFRLKTRKVGGALHGWNKKKKRTLQEKTNKLKKAISKLSSRQDTNVWGELKTLEKQLNVVLEKDEKYWRQRSRALWLKWDDLNTKYFHRKASARRKKNEIKGLMDSTGIWQTDIGMIRKLVEDYYGSLFSASSPHMDQVEEVLRRVRPKVTNDMNEELLRPFVAKEVIHAVKHMNPVKAPGVDDWVETVMRCVTSVSFSFLINGDVQGRVIPERGLRQRDPLSPFLFLFCAEAFSNLIQHDEQEGRLRGLRFGRHGLSVSHLFFADDSLIFMDADMGSCQRFKGLLDLYSAASGQLVNFHKSEVCFGRNVDRGVRQQLATFLGVREVEHHGKYLGLPSFVGRNKKEFLDQIKNKVWAKMKGWKSSMFSMAGKEVLIKAVVQAIPTYAMSCFRLSKKTISSIHRMAARFWWGSSDKENKIHWCKWTHLCKSKEKGGLGFRDLGLFNQALLAKQVWRCIRLTKENTSSFVWRSLMWGKKVINNGYRWRVGNGENVRVLEDPWLPRPVSFKIYDKPPLPENLYVADLKNGDGSWDENFVRSVFNMEDAELILSMPSTGWDIEDKIMWHYSKNGEYTVKSGYKMATSLASEQYQSDDQMCVDWWKALWRLKIPPKIKHFVWKLVYNWIPTNANLAKRGVDVDNICVRCSGHVVETAAHALWECKRSKEIWALGTWWIGVGLIRFEFWGGVDRESLLHDCVKWAAPEFGHMKVNVDAGVKGGGGLSGLRCVVRDQGGGFIMPLLLSLIESWIHFS
uniref:CCHC-type domain-containing protein n=1 Tax=Cannabis sativa TaxID=3483 RepID=A0A803NGM9_CANSA